MTAPAPRPGLTNIRAHMAAAAAPPGGLTVDIANNESAFGPSPRARAAAAGAAGRIERYPVDGPGRLTEAIAAAHGLDPARIVCGHGSDDLLARLARAYLRPGDELVHSINSYQKIPNYAHANDAVPVAAADRDFTVDVDAVLGAVTPRTRMVMIANPDNPTGTMLGAGEVRRLHAGLPGGVVLVLDSAYAEYVDAPDYELPDRLVEAHANIVMTRTFSKIHGLAGARVGWAYAPPAMADALRRIGITFPLAAPSLAAALAALEDPGHLAHVRAETLRLRAGFAARLARMGLEVCPSQTNFVLARFPDPARPATGADAYLLARGIQARRMAARSFADCLRFTIGLEAEMELVARALEDYMAGGGQ